MRKRIVGYSFDITTCHTIQSYGSEGKSVDEKIGFFYLDYYEQPQKTATISAEAGGDFTIEFDEK